jgi:MscS family membrane protein
VILLAVAIYVIYQFGEGDSLGRFLTGLGVLGLAASLAAQDALKSFFSTLLLIGERSFKLGDQIAFGTFEGTVEQVGFRATRIRTPEGTLLTVPNSTIASAAIDNRSTKAFSRCRVSLLVNYDTTRESVVALRDALRQWISDQSYLRGDKSTVSVNRLTDRGVEVLLDLQLTQVGGALEKQIREEINCAVLRVCEEVSPSAVSYRHPLAVPPAPLPLPLPTAASATSGRGAA